jgi:hypothetical protein
MNTEPVAWLYYDEWNKLKLGKTMPPDHNWFPVYTHPASEVICLSKAEIESGLSRVKWAELLIKQLPEEHEGRNSWLLNYGDEK